MIETLLSNPPPQLAPILVAAAALAVVIVCGGLFLALGLSEKDVASRLGAYVGPVQRDRHAGPAPKRKGGPNKRSFSESIIRELGKADLKFTPSEYIGLHFLCALVLFLFGYLFSKQAGPGIMLGVVGLALPRLYVRYRQTQRLNAFSSQLSDTLALLANSLRSGYSLLQAMEAVSREAPEPSATEFGRVVWEVGLGLSPQEALNNLVARIESEDLGLMVTAINVQHEVGGNLARILDGIANTIRERVRIKGEIKSLTAQQTYTGYVIALLPVILGGVLYVINPKYMGQLFSTKTLICMPTFGLAIIAGLLIVVGFLIMRKVMQIEV